MTSGYVTSDGKDLDSRYLGISAKAASASKADTATTAGGLASGVDVSKNAFLTTQKRISVSASKEAWGSECAYTFTATGIFRITGMSATDSQSGYRAGWLKLAGRTLLTSSAGSSPLGIKDLVFCVKKNDKLTYYSGGYKSGVTGELFVTIN